MQLTVPVASGRSRPPLQKVPRRDDYTVLYPLHAGATPLCILYSSPESKRETDAIIPDIYLAVKRACRASKMTLDALKHF